MAGGDEMIRVFIAGPYWDEDPCIRLANVFRAKAAAAELVRRGYAVYCPHLMHYVHGDGITEAMWRRQDMAWLFVSHYILRLPGGSDGASDEVEQAVLKGIPVRFSLDEFPNLLVKESQ